MSLTLLFTASFQDKVTRDGGKIATAGAIVSAILLRPMRCRIQDVIDTSVAWVAPGRIRPGEAVCLEVTLKATSSDLVVVGREGIHITDYDRRRILRTELLPFLQKHFRNLCVRSFGRSFIVVMWQVGVEEPNFGIPKLELTPCDGPLRIVVLRNTHIPVAHERQLAGVMQDVVLSSSAFQRHVTRKAC